MERLQQLLQINRGSGEPFSALRTTANAEVHQDRAVIAPRHTLQIGLVPKVITIAIQGESLLHVRLHETGEFIPVYGFGILNTLPAEPYDFLVLENPNDESVDVNFLTVAVK